MLSTIRNTKKKRQNIQILLSLNVPRKNDQRQPEEKNQINNKFPTNVNVTNIRDVSNGNG